MINKIEDQRNEFKIKLTDNLEKVIISFLNADGGNIFIGVDDRGNILGLKGNIDILQRTIKDRIKDNIRPSIMGLFDVVVLEKDNKKYIKIIIAKGYEKPYYLKGMGMTPDSCFIRVGSAIESMSEENILNLFSKRVRNSLRNIESPLKDLEFKTLKIYYEEKGYEINDNFLKKLDLYTNNNEFNYIAYLLSDNNHISVQFAKYSGTDVYDLIENEDYGFKSLIKITDNILNKIMLENKTYTKLGEARRKEIKMYDYNAIRELVINALVHNDWTNGYSPKFEIFKDKLVISSNGGIQEGVSQEEFLKGFTNPRNPELMRVFRDLEFVEQLGTGIQRVLKVYDKNIFEFYPNHIRVTIPFNDNTLNSKKNEEFIENNSLSKIQNSILQLIQTKPTITQDEIAKILGVTRRTIIRNFKVLLDGKYMERTGTNKKGYWKILK